MHKSKWFLIGTVYYSRYPYVLKMSSIASKDVVSAWSFCFPVLGTPEEIICDKAKYFITCEYVKFAAHWGFSITTCNPHYPKGHSFIERQVQGIKKLLARCDEDGTNYHLALKELCESPLTAICSHQQSFSLAGS